MEADAPGPAFHLGDQYFGGGSGWNGGLASMWALGEAGVSDAKLARIFKRFMYDMAVDAQQLLPERTDIAPLIWMPFSAESGTSDDSRVSVKESGYKLIREFGGTWAYPFEIWRYHETVQPIAASDLTDPDNPAYDWDLMDECFRLADRYEIDIALPMAFSLLDFFHTPLWARIPGDFDNRVGATSVTRIDKGGGVYEGEFTTTGPPHGLYLGQEVEVQGQLPLEYREVDALVTEIISPTVFRYSLQEDPVTPATQQGYVWVRAAGTTNFQMVDSVGYKDSYKGFLTAFMTRYADKTRLKWHICSDFAWQMYTGMSAARFTAYKDFVEECVNIVSVTHNTCKSGISTRSKIDELATARFEAIATVCDTMWATWYPELDPDFKSDPDDGYDRDSWDLQYNRAHDVFDATGLPWGWIETNFSSDDSLDPDFDEGSSARSVEFAEFMLAKAKQYNSYHRGMDMWHNISTTFLYQFSDNCDYDSGIFQPIFTGDLQEWVDGIGLFYKLGTAETIMVDAGPTPNKQLQATHDVYFNSARKQ
jgi:hypothetical protein